MKNYMRLLKAVFLGTKASQFLNEVFQITKAFIEHQL